MTSWSLAGPSLRGVRLSSRVLAASAVVAVLVAAVVATLVLATNALQRSTSRTLASRDVTVATLGLENLVMDVDSGLRGYILSGNESSLAPWREAEGQLPGAERTLRRLVAGEPAQARTTARLVGVVDAYVEEYARPMLAIARDAPAAARSPVAAVEDKRRMDEIRGLFARLLAAERARTHGTAAAAGRTSDLAVAVGAAALAASMLLVFCFGLYVVRSVARPLRAFAAGAARLSRSDFSARLAESGPGEIGQLASAFNEMAESLQHGRRELEEQNARLRASEQLKSELVAIVSHEVRTPLTSVLGFTRLLLERDVDADARTRYLRIIDDQGQRLATLLEDFLDAQAIEERGLELRRQRVDVREVLRGQVALFGGPDARRFALDVDERPLVVLADVNRVAQVVGNLLSNAIKYSSPESRVDVAAARAGETVRVTVRDRGRGIPRELQPQIFTKFFRGDAAATGIAGTGLGLAVARDIVEAHGGRIGFDSEPGAGSTFWIELPAVDPAP